MERASAINYFVTIFMLCSPITAIPVFLSLSQGRHKSDRMKIGIYSGTAVATILVIATWFGESILGVLGIRIAAFQCAGGIIVMLLALSMLNATVSPIRQSTDETSGKVPTIAVVPLAIPLMAGPGAISAVIVSANRFSGFENLIQMTICNVAIGVVTTFLLIFALPIEKKLGSTGLNLVTRIGGLILSAMAVEIFTSGLEGLKIIS